ncbi:hypothetical protein Dimus_023441 [Dionaea muscipula]
MMNNDNRHSTQPPPPQDEQNIIQEDAEMGSGGCGGCFRSVLFRLRNPTRSRGLGADGNDEAYLLRQQTSSGVSSPWPVKKLKEIKEMSEMVAGPKWKTFIRKIGAYFNGKRTRRRRTQNNFQYDSFDYTLNFDDGDDQLDDQDRIRFSTRFAPPGIAS